MKTPQALGFSLKTLSGHDRRLADYAGKVVLFVNVASKCGYTPQYEGLEALHRKYKDRGLAVLGFPSNDFGAQEPGTAVEIDQFCKLNYGVTFDLFEKITVKGSGKHALYSYLTSSEAVGSASAGEVKWNFQKYLMSRDGKLEVFGAAVTPAELDAKIAALL